MMKQEERTKKDVISKVEDGEPLRASGETRLQKTERIRKEGNETTKRTKRKRRRKEERKKGEERELSWINKNGIIFSNWGHENCRNRMDGEELLEEEFRTTTKTSEFFEMGSDQEPEIDTEAYALKHGLCLLLLPIHSLSFSFPVFIPLFISLSLSFFLRLRSFSHRQKIPLDCCRHSLLLVSAHSCLLGLLRILS
jgi:hypothetical protein